MSHLQPDTNDSIKDKCAKVCYLYMLDFIDEVKLLTWLMDYKAEFLEKEFINENGKKRFQKSMSQI